MHLNIDEIDKPLISSNDISSLSQESCERKPALNICEKVVNHVKVIIAEQSEKEISLQNCNKYY